MEFLNNKDYVTYNNFPNLRIYIPCIDNLNNLLSSIKPDIELYFPIVNASLINKHKIIYTNYDFYIHIETTQINHFFSIYNYSNNTCIDTVQIYVSTPDILLTDKAIKAFTRIIKNSIIVKDNIHIKLDNMLYMNEKEQQIEIQKFIDKERKQFLKDRHESDQIIEKLDSKILQYRNKIRELEEIITSSLS